jgi:hypothetical protein
LKHEKHSGKKYLYLFDQPCEGVDDARKVLKHKNTSRYRTKRIYAGDHFEIECYPLWNTNNEVRNAKKAATREAQKDLNDKNAIKWATRLVNENFTADDLGLTLGYPGKKSPSLEEAKRDLRNYLRRAKDYFKRNDLGEFKYFFVTQYGVRNKRIHHHGVMTGMDREIAEALWRGWTEDGSKKANKLSKAGIENIQKKQHGYFGNANSISLTPDEYGLIGWSNYITKDPQGAKRWTASRNLKKPEIKPPVDNKISKRKVEQMVMDFQDKPREIFEDMFPGYEFLDIEIKRSNYVAGAYIYVRMHRRPPPAGKKKGRGPGTG